jgi:capsular polysaccharide biosynthesis protein
LSQGEKRYVLYEYLMFLWRKKLLLLALPLLFALIGAGLSFLKDRPYVGQLSFYTGEVESKDLLRPDLVKEKYEMEGFSYTVSAAEKTMIFTSVGNDPDRIEKTLQKVTKQYEKDLMDKSEEKLELKKNELEFLKNKRLSLEESLKIYHDYIENKDIDPELAMQYSDSINEAEDKVLDYTQKINTKENSILNFDEPQKMTMVINREESYIISNVILGTVLGLLLALGLILIWKYVTDARRGSIR